MNFPYKSFDTLQLYNTLYGLQNIIVILVKKTKASLTPYVVETRQGETSSVKTQNSQCWDGGLFLCLLHLRVGLPRCQDKILHVG